ncbi:hypothetical protein BLOT_010766 [Blomia tropicalis]|nr:hypothetical protein BLOT_010766 [Blomia tropicalis]
MNEKAIRGIVEIFFLSTISEEGTFGLNCRESLYCYENIVRWIDKKTYVSTRTGYMLNWSRSELIIYGNMILIGLTVITLM